MQRYLLSNRLRGLAEWLATQGYAENAKMVRSAIRIVEQKEATIRLVAGALGAIPKPRKSK